MTKWTKIWAYFPDMLRERMAAERQMLKEIATQNCMYPDCLGEEGTCLFGCPFESDKRK